MNILKAKRIRHFLRLSYPARVIARDNLFHGDYPDLPGCEAAGGDLARVYQELETRRRDWITSHVLEGANVPMPNSYLSEDGEGTDAKDEDLSHDDAHEAASSAAVR